MAYIDRFNPPNMHHIGGINYVMMTDCANMVKEIERLREALREMVNEKCEYMHINHLGNPETTHTIKLARKALVEKK